MTTFTARIVSGVKRGRRIGYPTVNLDVVNVPANLAHGIYACRVGGDRQQKTGNGCPAVIHYGTHPAFHDERVTFEVHFLIAAPAEGCGYLQTTTEGCGSLTVEIVRKIRDVQDFASTDALRAQIQKDCDEARAILQSPC